MKKIIYQDLRLAILFIIISLNFCAKKPVIVWQGYHADIETHEQPKEDFKVNDYIVIAYAPCEYNENSKVLYKFALTLEGKQIALFYLEEASKYGYFLCHEYFKGYHACIKDINKFFVSDYSTYATFELWRDRPEYTELKYHIIAAVAGSNLTYTQSIGNDDSVKIVLFSNRTWEYLFFSDSNYAMTVAIPNIITVESGQKIGLTNDKTWDFLHPDSLKQENVHGTISLNRNAVDIEVVPYDRVEKKPIPVFNPIPQYPDAAKNYGITGTTIVKILVDIDGGVMKTNILQSSRNGHLDLAALMSAMKARFEPAMHGNEAVRVWVSRPYKFKLR